GLTIDGDGQTLTCRRKKLERSGFNGIAVVCQKDLCNPAGAICNVRNRDRRCCRSDEVGDRQRRHHELTALIEAGPDRSGGDRHVRIECEGPRVGYWLSG